MIREFKYAFKDLSIQPEDLHELLGFENNVIPEPFPEYIQSAIEFAPKLCSVQGGYRLFNAVAIDTENYTISIEDQCFSPSKTVAIQLKQSEKAALFMCTAGAGISEHANRISAENDPMMGYVFDILGSVTVEKAMNKIQFELQEEVKLEGLGITDRYSPGYCEWSVGEQQKLFSFFPENFCQIQLSESSLMHPIKSVSGIIGIGKDLHPKGYQCNWCTDQNCIYGRLRRKN